MGNGCSAGGRAPAVGPMLFAVRPTGRHLVAMTTSPGTIPSWVNPAASRRSDSPRPYNSAVSNRVMPPAMAVLTMASASVWAIGEKNPDSIPRAENCMQPNPIGETWMPVLPSSRVLIGQTSFHALDPLSPRWSRLERIAEVLRLVDHFPALEFQDAARVERL